MLLNYKFVFRCDLFFSCTYRFFGCDLSIWFPKKSKIMAFDILGSVVLRTSYASHCSYLLLLVLIFYLTYFLFFFFFNYVFVGINCSLNPFSVSVLSYLCSCFFVLKVFHSKYRLIQAYIYDPWCLAYFIKGTFLHYHSSRSFSDF